MTAAVREGRAGVSRSWALELHPASVRLWPWALAVVALISVYYAFLASAGRFEDIPEQLSYYDRMCEGFRRGHLYIVELPSRQLLRSPDPFDDSHFPQWLWDASLYKGHYYMYWGPVPALMLLAFKVATGTHRVITDQWLTTLFMVGRLFAGAALIWSLASRARIRQPVWVSVLAIAAFGLANPSPFTVARPHVYEACLVAGQCFLFWGLLWAFWGVELPSLRRRFFLLAGASWALAIGCRATTFVSVPLLILVSAAAAWHGSNRALKPVVYDCLALGLPVAFSTCAYGVYNYARFDSVFEFGLHLQVTLQPFKGLPVYVVPNLLSYLGAPVLWSCHFPFVTITDNDALSKVFDFPLGYRTFERVGGILRTAWWCWLVPFFIWRVARHASARVRSVASSSAPRLTKQEIFVFVCSIAVALSVAPALMLWEASMRYVGDAMGGITMLAALAAFWLVRRANGSKYRAVGVLTRAFVAVLGIQTCVIGALAAFTAYDDPIKTLNPVLYNKLENSLSLCNFAR